MGMYFASRVQAGRQLAAQLLPKYRYENCAVVALSDGGVMVGAQIASQLHCVITMILSEAINLPREPVPIGGVTQDGTFSYNHAYSSGEIDEMVSEYHAFIEQQKMEKVHDLNHLITSSGKTTKDLLRGHHVILVSDGFKDSFELDMAMEFLKPVSIEKLIVATPLASVKAVDRMHIMADEIVCLSVVADYMDTPHYYDQQDVPDHALVVKTIEEIVLNWR